MTAHRVAPAAAEPPPPAAPPATTSPAPKPKIKFEDLPVPDQVEAYAVLGVSDADIATHVHCDAARLRTHYRAELARGRARRRTSLRTWQWKQAEEGTVSILTLLGKCELGQNDSAPPEEEKVIACRRTPLDLPAADKPPE